MSRKDYVALAASLHNAKDATREILGSHSVLRYAAENIADVLAIDNPRFDRQRFLTAAGFVSADPR
jgi:hypothetical protein